MVLVLMKEDSEKACSVLVNHIESAGEKGFYRVFVEDFIARFSGWNLGWGRR